MNHEHGHCSIKNESERGSWAGLSQIYADKNHARNAQGVGKQAGRYNQGRIQLTDAAARPGLDQARIYEASIFYL